MTNEARNTCINECVECARECETCATQCCAPAGGEMAGCLRTCLDCATVCWLCASLCSRDSQFCGDMCRLCARVCNACADECSKHEAEQHLDELNNRLESRKKERELEHHSAVSDITHLGRAWVDPHPDRSSPNIAPMVRDDEIERIAVEVRFIEVKGRAGVGIVALSENEYRTAERLKNDYWLYAVFNCAGTPELHTVQNPARLGWQPVMAVEDYRIEPGKLTEILMTEK